MFYVEFYVHSLFDKLKYFDIVGVYELVLHAHKLANFIRKTVKF